MTYRQSNRAKSWSVGAAADSTEQVDLTVAWNLVARGQIETHLMEVERAVDMMSVTIQQSRKRIALSNQLLKRRSKTRVSQV